MITSNTVFILGAGASKPFGYPTGIELREIICTNFQELPVYTRDHDLREKRFAIFKKLGYPQSDLVQFRKQFYRSALPSIDTFLEHRPEYVEIGKLAIADALISFENENKLFENNSQNWYSYLLSRLLTKFEDFTNNKIAFITFNYDRSLEQFLCVALQNSYGKSIQQVVSVIKKIPIIHVYGKIDDLPWQNTEGNSYCNTRNGIVRDLRKAANMIEIIPEDQDVSSNENFIKAYELLSWASKICFLGFGFHPTNMERLKINDYLRSKNAEGTAYKLEPSKKREIQRYTSNQITLREPDVDVLEFLKRYGDFT